METVATVITPGRRERESDAASRVRRRFCLKLILTLDVTVMQSEKSLSRLDREVFPSEGKQCAEGGRTPLQLHLTLMGADSTVCLTAELSIREMESDLHN